MKTTLDLLMAKAEQSKDDKLQIKKFDSKAIGGEIILKKPPLSKFTSLIDEADAADTTYGALEVNAQMVYESVPAIKDNFSKLKDAYEVSDPINLVLKIFEDNLVELQLIVEEITSFYGFELVGNLKN